MDSAVCAISSTAITLYTFFISSSPYPNRFQSFLVFHPFLSILAQASTAALLSLALHRALELFEHHQTHELSTTSTQESNAKFTALVTGAVTALVAALVHGVLCTFLAHVLLAPPFYTKPRTNVPGGALVSYPHPSWQGIDKDPKTNLGLNYVDVEFETQGGAKLRGWLVHPSNIRNDSNIRRGSEIRECVIVCHGTGRDRRAFLRHCAFLVGKANLCALLFDFREHGTSDGSLKGTSYCIRETQDVISAVLFAKSTACPYGPFNKIALLGTSMGASTCLLAATRSEISQSISCVIAENPFSDTPRVLADALAFFAKVPRWVMLVGARAAISRLGVEAVKEHNAIEKISQIPEHCKVLLLHGTRDMLVPVEHSIDLFAKLPQNAGHKLVVMEGGRHTQLYNLDPDRFENVVLEHLKSAGFHFQT
eukprot:c21631_g1_i1.p1 GENE.c21631_g1_i1~~c21631_g1_i1.p1  ORF type:complete len:435 (+),score=93.75 c21631_g1_i1:35-1306(+)